MTGKISSVRFEGVEFAGKEKLESDDPTIGIGFFNEFGIDHALGFDEAKQGEQFHKIGVGLLRKDNKRYDFLRQYKLQPCQFQLESAPDEIRMTSKPERLNEYAYVLTKRIQLIKNGFVVGYNLENTGKKTIRTDEYNHNFITINSFPVGNSHRLHFLFEMNPAKFLEFVNPENKIRFTQNEITFENNPEEFFFSNLSGGEEVEVKWTLEHLDSGYGIQETTDFTTHKINLWGNGHVICPELFKTIHLQPGETDSWKRTYTFFKRAM